MAGGALELVTKEERAATLVIAASQRNNLVRLRFDRMDIRILWWPGPGHSPRSGFCKAGNFTAEREGVNQVKPISRAQDAAEIVVQVNGRAFSRKARRFYIWNRERIGSGLWMGVGGEREGILVGESGGNDFEFFAWR